MFKLVVVFQLLLIAGIIGGVIWAAPYVGDALGGLVDRVDHVIGYDQ